MKRTASLAAAVAASLTVTVILGTGAAAAHDRPGGSSADRDLYGTKAPYAPQQAVNRYQRAPRGFTPVFTENVARHGSRAMSDGEDGDAVLAVLRRAQEQQALTGLGARLAPQVQTLLDAAAGIGYGNLSGRGVQEQQQIARRLEQRLPQLFAAVAAGHEPIVVETSGVARAVASANAFTGGLAAGDPAVAGLIQAPVTDKNLLYFHKQPQNADYQAYLASDPQLAAVLAQIDGRPRTAEAAGHVVARLFRADFAAAMPVADRIAFARSLYQLYSAAPDLAVEAPAVDLRPFLTDEDARWFAYLDDAEEFYRSGPAFAGRTITYKMAGVLLDDLFARAEAKAAGTSADGAVLRFTHAEEVEPLAALLGLPGSTRPAPADQPYAYRTNPWRGAEVAPMAANVQWDLYASTPKDGKPAEHLVRMLYNERETAFKASCRPIAKGSYFYDLDELKRCFGRA
ncbi:histidine-type phosphatase [Kitasatospora sp. NPDC094015]|uniref:histidine-type phosphatase n=1 Tax=Kitasatospora sp. NPDC094015 TaxID=3155205 RepID=UPI00332AC303